LLVKRNFEINNTFTWSISLLYMKLDLLCGYFPKHLQANGAKSFSKRVMSPSSDTATVMMLEQC